MLTLTDSIVIGVFQEDDDNENGKEPPEDSPKSELKSDDEEKSDEKKPSKTNKPASKASKAASKTANKTSNKTAPDRPGGEKKRKPKDKEAKVSPKLMSRGDCGRGGACLEMIVGIWELM